MAAGLALSTLFGIRALHDRDEARERAALAQAVNNFLTEDLLGRGNPAQSGKADETLMGAAEAAEAGIDRRLADEPMEAGAIYLSLARAFDSRTAEDAARHAYDQAIAAFTWKWCPASPAPWRAPVPKLPKPSPNSRA
jgi:non-specific serine/threonine protein kinase